MKNTLGHTLLAATLVLGASFLAPSSADAQERTASPSQNRALAQCQGFAQEFVNTLTQTTAFSTASPGFVEMPSTRIAGGASGDVDLYTVTFSGQASATGGGFWEIQAQVSVSGGPFLNMNPQEPDTFHTGNPAQTHTMTWCREISGTPTFRIVWRKAGGGAAIIDDYTMRVERSN